MKPIKIFLILLVAASPAFAQSIPATKARALDDSEVTLPSPGQKQILILVLGFSHKSGESCKVWAKRIGVDYGADARIVYYILPVIQSAPSFVRPMILKGMRKDTAPGQLPHYVPLVSSEADWKNLTSYGAPDDPYLIVATTDGHPVWQGHGSFTDGMYADLKKAVAELLDKSAAIPNKN